jgi:hypothetical protein
MSLLCYQTEYLPNGGPVASSEDLALLHQAMHAVTYRRITMAIKTTSKVGLFVHRCLFAFCPGSCWGNTERVAPDGGVQWLTEQPWTCWIG